MSKNKYKIRRGLLSAAIVILVTVVVYYFLLAMEPQLPLTEVVKTKDFALQTVEELFPYMIRSKSTLFKELRDLQVSPQDIQEIVTAAKPVNNLAQLRAGTRFQILNDESGKTNGIKFRFSAIEMLEIKKQNEIWVANKIIEKVDLKVITYAGIVTSSLWESAERAKMDPNLISDLADIFGWQIDFAREVRLNDRWRLSVEQKFVKGEAIGWGSIIAAEYENAGEVHSAVLFKNNGEEVGYFAPNGASLRRMFLKSPIKFARISSRFSRNRFHPILHIRRAHLGVDYAAPIGTPIRAVGDGVISKASWSGGGGNTIKIRHNSTYETAYKHLSGYAKSTKTGARVKQGDVIGYVGNTGLSTAPHLHFEFYQSGHFVDPLGKKFPTADPVPAALMTQFQASVPQVLSSLPQWSAPEISIPDTAQGSVSSSPAGAL